MRKSNPDSSPKKRDAKDLKIYVNEQIDAFRRKSGDDAFFNLIDLPETAVPILQEAAEVEHDCGVKKELVRVIWHYKMSASIPFLLKALEDRCEEVRRESVSGLVALSQSSHAQVFNGLTNFRENLKATQGIPDREFLEYLKEAIEQCVPAQAIVNPPKEPEPRDK